MFPQKMSILSQISIKFPLLASYHIILFFIQFANEPQCTFQWTPSCRFSSFSLLILC